MLIRFLRTCSDDLKLPASIAKVFVAFSGSWQGGFEPVPGLRDFKLRSGEKVQRSFMRRNSGHFGLTYTEKLRLIRIPYQEAGFSMLFAIPQHEDEDIREYS